MGNAAVIPVSIETKQTELMKSFLGAGGENPDFDEFWDSYQDVYATVMRLASDGIRMDAKDLFETHFVPTHTGVDLLDIMGSQRADEISLFRPFVHYFSSIIDGKQYLGSLKEEKQDFLHLFNALT